MVDLINFQKAEGSLQNRQSDHPKENNQIAYFAVNLLSVRKLITATCVLRYLTKLQSTDLQTMKTAMIYGNTMGSFAVETFSVDKLVKLSISEIENRAKSIMDKSNK